jgi:hypothetical protein
MRHALIIAQHFTRQDDRLLRIRSAIQGAGYAVTSLAFESGGETMRAAETRDLRPRALGLLMLTSQLVIAAVIAGYFTRFYPIAMTVVFWLVVMSGIYLASPMGQAARNALLARLGTGLGQLDTAKTRFDVIWAANSESLELARRLAKRDGARLIFDARETGCQDDEIRRQCAISDVAKAVPDIDQWVAENTETAALYETLFGASKPALIPDATDTPVLNAVITASLDADTTTSDSQGKTSP